MKNTYTKLYSTLEATFTPDYCLLQSLRGPISFGLNNIQYGDCTINEIRIEQNYKNRVISLKARNGVNLIYLFKLLNNIVWLLGLCDGYSLVLSMLTGKNMSTLIDDDLLSDYRDKIGTIEFDYMMPCKLVNYEKVITNDVLTKWNNLMDGGNLFVENIKLAFIKNGLTNDVKLAYMIIGSEFICDMNGKHTNDGMDDWNKYKFLSTMIADYKLEEIFFDDQYSKCKNEKIIEKLVKTRNNVMHASRTPREPYLDNGSDILKFKLKFNLAYRIIALVHLADRGIALNSLIDSINTSDHLSFNNDTNERMCHKCSMINAQYYHKFYSGQEFCKDVICEGEGIEYRISVEERKTEDQFIRVITIKSIEEVLVDQMHRLLLSIEKLFMTCDGYFLHIDKLSLFGNISSREELEKESEYCLSNRLKYFNSHDAFCNKEYQLLDIKDVFEKDIITSWWKYVEMNGNRLNMPLQVYFYCTGARIINMDIRLVLMIDVADSLTEMLNKYVNDKVLKNIPSNKFNKNFKSLKDKIEILMEMYGKMIFKPNVSNCAQNCADFRNAQTHKTKKIGISNDHKLEYLLKLSVLYRKIVLAIIGCNRNSLDHRSKLIAKYINDHIDDDSLKETFI